MIASNVEHVIRSYPDRTLTARPPAGTAQANSCRYTNTISTNSTPPPPLPLFLLTFPLAPSVPWGIYGQGRHVINLVMGGLRAGINPGNV